MLHEESRRRRFPHAITAVGAALVTSSLACGELDVVPNRDTEPEASAIVGTVSTEEAIVGDVVMLLYTCDNPPPPASTGRPIDFVIVNREEFDKGAAEYIFPLVTPGSGPDDSACYEVHAFMDADHDWNPFYTVAGQKTATDVVATAGTTVEVFGAPAAGDPIPLATGVDIELDRVLDYDLPVFDSAFMDMTGELEDPPPMELQLGAQNEDGDPYDLHYMEMDTLPITSPLVDLSEPRFQMIFAADADGDGYPDDVNGDGLSDVEWPKVLFLKIDPADPTGQTTVTPSIVIPGVVLPFDPTFTNDDYNHVFNYIDEGLPFDGVTEWPVDHLNVVVPELLVTDLATAETELLEAQDPEVVTGEYQVLVMNPTGQLWSTPNILTEYGVELQDQRLTVVP